MFSDLKKAIENDCKKIRNDCKEITNKLNNN